MTRDEKKAKDRWEYVSDRLCNSDYPIYNEEHELESAFDAGVKWCEEHPNWISVEDELPKEEGRYIFYDEILGPQVSTYYEGCTLVSSITHWMPLPSPPRKESEI